MGQKRLKLFLILALSLANQGSTGFPHKTKPTAQSWQYFFKMGERGQRQLWQKKWQQGIGLGDWSWQWRLGWVRACSESISRHCLDILAEATSDKALVVRAEAARAIGTRFRGTENTKAVKILASIYRNPSNLRKKKPLFVQKSVLRALWQIKGPTSQQMGKQLASSSRVTKRYWQKLNASKLN